MLDKKETRSQIEIPNLLNIQKVTSIPKNNPMDPLSTLYLIKLPEYDQPVKIKEQYIDELIFKLERLKNK